MEYRLRGVTVRIGVICPSEIALRRFMPALQKCDSFSFAGVGVYKQNERFGDITEPDFLHARETEIEKAKQFVSQYGGKIFDGYVDVVTSSEVDAVYIPLPPALHFQWAKKALENGKHVMVEKPATLNAGETRELVAIAQKRGLALHENYMFIFHKQLNEIDRIINSGSIGDIRLYRISFGFPRRDPNDFRYNKALGGGALIDAGGYAIQYATHLLGSSVSIAYAQSNYIDEFEVDIYGSAALVNEEGATVQIAFGMDNNYKCEVEVWGSKGCLTTGRILTAPVGYTPTAIIRNGNTNREVTLSEDDAFQKSIIFFHECITSKTVRDNRYISMIKQADLVEEFRSRAKTY